MIDKETQKYLDGLFDAQERKDKIPVTDTIKYLKELENLFEGDNK